MLRRVLLFLVPLALLLAPPAALAIGPYSVTDLGTLGGESSYGTALNDLGHVVGYSALPSGENRAFLWTPGGGMQNLGLIGAGDSQALDINNNENIVGVTGITSLGDSNRAFRWTPSTGMVLIDSENSGQASGLNSNDVAIGHRNLPTGNATRVRTWSPTDSIGNPYPFANLYGIAINDLGQFVGADPSQFGPVRGRYSPGSGPTINLNQFIPSDLNNARQIVGYERIDAQSGLAGLIDLDTNTKTILGKLAPSDASSQALGINQAGTIVGVSGASGAFITDQNHNLLSLTSLLDPAFSGWTILSADDINNAGQIVALGQFQDGLQHAVLLSPVPEPSTWLLATIAVLSVALRRSYLHHC